jgi:putative spermidine/putrescine transport system substrate-binding protein
MLARVFLTAVTLLVTLPADTYALTIATTGETTGRAIAEAYGRPFTAVTGIPVHEELWTGELDALRKRPPDNDWDILRVGPDELAAGCAAGLFEKLDWPAIGGKDHYLPIGVSDCGVGATVDNLVLAWDRDKFPATPTWADFWDVAKIPGKRGLPRTPRGVLEFALLADGVSPGDVYKTLATSDGVNRAFRKLDQLKPYIVWWRTQEDAVKILGSGDVLMTATPSREIFMARGGNKRQFGVRFAESLYEPKYWVVLKDSPHLREAWQFLWFVGAPSIEARMFRASGEIGLAVGANNWLTPEQQALSPLNPPNASGALRIDNGFWHDNLAKLTARFDTWVAQSQ